MRFRLVTVSLTFTHLNIKVIQWVVLFIIPTLVYNICILFSECDVHGERLDLELECAARMTAAFIHILLCLMILFTFSVFCMDQIEKFQIRVIPHEQ